MSVRSLALRLRRLEQAHAPALSPFEAMPGGLVAWEASCQAGIDAGSLDSREAPMVMAAVRRWHNDRVWEQ